MKMPPLSDSRIIIITPVPDASSPQQTQKTQSYPAILHALADRIAAGENIIVDVLYC